MLQPLGRLQECRGHLHVNMHEREHLLGEHGHQARFNNQEICILSNGVVWHGGIVVIVSSNIAIVHRNRQD